MRFSAIISSVALVVATVMAVPAPQETETVEPDPTTADLGTPPEATEFTVVATVDGGEAAADDGAVAGLTAAVSAVSNIIELWNSPYYQGGYYTASVLPGQCVNLLWPHNNIKSSGRARLGYWCIVYDGAFCTGAGYSFIQDDNFPVSIDNRASSWRCGRLYYY
jgi:hypothetical protein